MTIEEMLQRIVKGHLLVIALCTLIPLGLVLALQVQSSPTYVATMRLQVLSAAPSSTTEADGLSSRVLALGTSPSLVNRALSEAGVSADAVKVARTDVTAERLGESSVVELHVRAGRPGAAAATAKALATQVANFMNEGSRSEFDRALRGVDRAVTSATRRRDDLIVRLQETVESRNRENVQFDLDAAQRTLDHLVDEQSSLVLANTSRDRVVLVGTVPVVTQAPSGLIPRSALALLLGLVLGLTMAVILETLRPRLAGIRVLARSLGAPVLGATSDASSTLANAMVLAARRQGVDTVVLLGVEERDERLVRKLLDELPRTWASAAVFTSQLSGWSAGGASDDIGPVVEPDAASLSPGIRFTDLYGVSTAEERTAGVVVLASGSARQSRLDSLDDVLKAMRWPIVGILESTGHRSFWGRR
jgi:capsular polysaccharide biosynthesis protein